MKINSKTKYNYSANLPEGLDHGAKIIFRTIDEIVKLFGDKFGVEYDEANNSINYNSDTGAQLSLDINLYKEFEGKEGTIMRRPSLRAIEEKGEAAAEYCIHTGYEYVWFPLFTIKRADSETNESLVINSKTKYNNHSLNTYKRGDEVYVMALKDVIERANEIPGVDVYTDDNDIAVYIKLSDPKTGDIIGNRIMMLRSLYDKLAEKKTRVLEIDNADPYMSIKVDGSKHGVWVHPVFLN